MLAAAWMPTRDKTKCHKGGNGATESRGPSCIPGMLLTKLKTCTASISPAVGLSNKAREAEPQGTTQPLHHSQDPPGRPQPYLGGGPTPQAASLKPPGQELPSARPSQVHTFHDLHPRRQALFYDPRNVN